MSLVTQLNSALTTLGTAIKGVKNSVGSLASLSTTAKSDLVSAINEVNAKPAGATINDITPSAATVYSSNKTNSAITAAVAAVVNGAPAAFDTLKEISDQLAADETSTATLFANRLRVDAVQSLNATQKQQARDNIDVWSKTEIGDVTTDFVAVVNAALA